MEKFEIIFIDSNDFDLKNIVTKDTQNFNELDDLLKIKTNYVDYDKTYDILKDICHTKEVTKETFMEEIVKYIGLDEQHYGDVRDCYESKEFTYQIMYKMTNQEDNIDKLKYNLLASYLTFNKELIYGNAVLFKTYISIDKPDEDKVINTSLNNVIELAMNNSYHTGVYIDSNNNFEQIFFDNDYNIVDPFNKWRRNYKIPNIIKDDNYGFKEDEYLQFNLKFIYNTKSEDSVNEPMCRLLHGLIKGDGVIISPFDANANAFYELTKNDIFDLLKVWNKLSQQISDHKKLGNKDKTKYQILNERIKNV
jgi:hypothetical protein